MGNYIILTDDAGKQHSFSGSTLLVFIDETGHEHFRDKDYRIFGFGGCLCYARDYHKLIYEPWKVVETFFDKSALPLHATDLKKGNMTLAKYTALNNFFTENTFGRFASIASGYTINSTDFEYLNIAIGNIHERVRSIIQWEPFDEVVFLIEASERTNQKVTNCFSSYKLLANGIEVPTHHFFMHKKDNEPGIIVADFIIHSAGTTVLAKRRNKISEYIERKDFKNVFCSVDEKLSSFIDINSIKEGPW